MPCRDYDYPTETASITEQNLRAQVNDMKKGLDNLTRMLCGVLHQVDQADMPNIYKQVGGLQEWWERHQRLDAIREQNERRALERRERKRQRLEAQQKLRISALDKLTAEERRALGLS